MAQDLTVDFSSGSTVTLLGSNLSDGSASAATSAVDFGATAPFGFGFELKLDCQTSSDATATLNIAWSHDNTDFSDSDNYDAVTVVQCTASTVVVKCGAYGVYGRYCKFSLQNDSGGTINSASTALVLTDIAGDQA